MNWDDVGFLISKNKYNENSLISEIYTKSHGKVSGIIFGGTSKKMKTGFQKRKNTKLIELNKAKDHQLLFLSCDTNKEREARREIIDLLVEV